MNVSVEIRKYYCGIFFYKFYYFYGPVIYANLILVQICNFIIIFIITLLYALSNVKIQNWANLKYHIVIMSV